MYFQISLRLLGQCIHDATHPTIHGDVLCSVLLRLLLRGRHGDHGNDTRLLVFLPRTALARPIAEEDLLAATALVQRVRSPTRKARACAAARSARSAYRSGLLCFQGLGENVDDARPGKIVPSALHGVAPLEEFGHPLGIFRMRGHEYTFGNNVW